jgi:two-component system nitrate/nitrite response regulator NarL
MSEHCFQPRDQPRDLPRKEVPVVLADDHAATRAGVRLALEGSGFVIVAEVATADAAVDAAVRLRPALCLIDLCMPGGGISATRRISAQVPECKVVILTVSLSDDDLFEALFAGASGYLLKDASAARLPETMHGVLAGEATLPRSLELRLIEEFRSRELRRRSRRRFRRKAPRDQVELTDREWEVLDLLGEHFPTTVIARRLGISEVTVRRHISSAMHKLNVPDRASALQVLGADDPDPEDAA